MQYQIVVSRYNEDISYLYHLKDIIIVYNKGEDDINQNFNSIKLPNIGRESHTYLYHIINNYDNLADKTIFFQGKIDDHKILDIEDYFGDDDFIGKFDNLNINKLINKIDHYGKYKNQYLNGKMKASNYTPYIWIKNILGIELEETSFKVVWGANFAISSKLIRNKPKIFYENILRYIENDSNPEEGHFLERSWYLIFNNNYIPKKKLGYVFIKNYSNRSDAIISNINNYDELHIWCPINSNFELGLENKISYTPNNYKYLKINPHLENNEFYLNIKGNNDAHILIEFEKYEETYEIVLGGWNNSSSVIRDYINNKILYNYAKPTLNKFEFIKFNFQISDKIIIKLNDEIIFNDIHIFENVNIKNIKIKSCFDSFIFWDYKQNNSDYNNNISKKYLLCNNSYENIKNFYINNYNDFYIHEVDLINYI
jgi:hypothetical protein